MFNHNRVQSTFASNTFYIFLSTPFLEIDECIPVSPCHANATCNNTEGSYTCTCNIGYSGDGITCDGKLLHTFDNCSAITFISMKFVDNFSEINECIPVPPCHANATCNNIEGSYTCTCNAGYSGDGLNCDGKLIYII